jgi:hypothetical protein
MALQFTDMTKTFREGKHQDPSTFGVQTIYKGGEYAVVNCGELDGNDVIEIAPMTAVTSIVGMPIEDFAVRTLGTNGTFTVMMPDNSAVSADIEFSWSKVRF